ncbi:MAG: AbrB/MazE/SpoVT family DNA-binding domain-containing protein [Longimicrobiales bacterium]
MPHSTLSTKGQLVVPKEVRDFLQVGPGDRIDFVVHDDGQVTIRPAVLDIQELRGLLHARGRPCVSVEDMKRAVKDRAR